MVIKWPLLTPTVTIFFHVPVNCPHVWAAYVSLAPAWLRLLPSTLCLVDQQLIQSARIVHRLQKESPFVEWQPTCSEEERSPRPLIHTLELFLLFPNPINPTPSVSCKQNLAADKRRGAAVPRDKGRQVIELDYPSEERKHRQLKVLIGTDKRMVECIEQKLAQFKPLNIVTCLAY